MRKIVLTAMVIGLFLVNACSKSDNSSGNTAPDKTAKTVQNLSGSYNITASTANVFGATLNLYDSLPACQRDNIIQLDTNLTAQFIDAGTACVPPTDSTGKWSLSSNSDTIYVAGESSFIKSWDGTTLVLTTSINVMGFPVTATSTFVKK
jgi:type II secretory pathway component GspD/PulD (secretin)